MPLRRGTSRSVVSNNIREMVAAGHPPRQAVAASLHEKDKSMRKDNDGIRQHKRMAEGESIEGSHESFGVEPFHDMNDGPKGRSYVEHPDRHNGTESRHLHDHERGAVHPIKHSEHHMHAQANANHGPHHHGHGHPDGPHHAPMERPHARGK